MWTEADIERLRIMWASVGRGNLLKAFPGRTYGAIRQKAVSLKLGPAHIRGTEHVCVVARECGYDGGNIPLFRRIMRWAGVEIHSHGRRYRTVDPIAAREAVRKWEKEAETLWDGWLRHTVEFKTLKQAMIDAGKIDPARFRRGDRFLKTDIDEAVRMLRERRARVETIRQAAKRLGVSPSTMMRALWLAGTVTKNNKTRGPKAALAVGDADRALAAYRMRCREVA